MTAALRAAAVNGRVERRRLCDEQPPFDVFVVDLMMPRMRGDELGRRLRQREPDVKVLYIYRLQRPPLCGASSLGARSVS